jgi:glutathione S-transferase
LEDWADTALAAGVRQALWQAAVADPVLRSALLPEATPSPLRRLVGALPGGVLSPLNDTVSEVINPLQASQLRRNLDQLLVLVRHSSYLEGEQLSLADLAVVAQLSLLRFAADAGAPLAGRGVRGFGDNPLYGPLFAWRDRILAEVGRG